MTLGEVDIAQIIFDKRSRDDIPKVLCGLQHLYLNKPLRDALFALLKPNCCRKSTRPWPPRHALVEHFVAPCCGWI
jgi:hypothetical protein